MMDYENENTSALVWTFEPTIKKLLDEIKRDSHPSNKVPHLKQNQCSRDHLKENKKYIRDLQKQIKQKQSKCSKPAGSSKSSTCYLKKRSDEQPSSVQSASAVIQHCCSARSTESTVNHSTCSACHMKEVKPKLVTPHPLGHIPSFVTRRKKFLEEEAKRIEDESKKPYVPPGHRFISEEERLETLDLLKQIQELLLESFARLPLVIETLRTKKHKEDLERRLAKVEEGIAFFSNPKVLVKIDS